jgi:hypothetical protein
MGSAHGELAPAGWDVRDDSWVPVTDRHGGLDVAQPPPESLWIAAQLEPDLALLGVSVPDFEVAPFAVELR